MSFSQSFLLSKSALDDVPKKSPSNPNLSRTVDDMIKEDEISFLYIMDF